MARPLKPISAEQVFKLARHMLSQGEIADVLGCDQSLISRRFASEVSRARSLCKMSIRRAQYIRAVKDRSDRMLCHLGRVELGQVIGPDVGVDLAAVLAEIIASGGDHERGR